MKKFLTLFSLALALEGCSTRACTKNTALLTVDYDGTAIEATSLQVLLSYPGEQPQQTTIAHTPGKTSGTFEITFASGYHAGQELSVTVVALKGGTPVGSAVDSFELAPSCTARTLEIRTGVVGDDGGSNPVDGGQVGDSGMRPTACMPECSGATPICNMDTFTCTACPSNEVCSQLSAATPLCAPSGACVACLSNSDCPSSSPVCDSMTGTCGVCTDNSECASGVCYRSNCLDADTIMFVNGSASNCPAGPSDGTSAAPYCTVQAGFDNAFSKNKPNVVVMSGLYQPPSGHALVVSNPAAAYNINAIGIGSPTVTVSAMQGDIVSINNTGTSPVKISFDGFTLRGASNDNDQGAGNGSAIAIQGGADPTLTNITVTNSKLDANYDDGILAQDSVVTADSDEFGSQTGGSGIKAYKAVASVTNSTFTGNATALDIEQSTATVDRVTGSKNVGALYILNSKFVVTNALFHHGGDAFTIYEVYISSATNPSEPMQVLFNVTIADTTQRTQGGDLVQCDTTTPSIINTVLYNTGTPQAGGVQMCNPQFSIFHVGSGTNSSTDTCWALFVDPSTNNYLPATGGIAPCTLVGQGISSYTPNGGSAVTTNHDVAGKPRQSGKYDIGAYQTQ